MNIGIRKATLLDFEAIHFFMNELIGKKFDASELKSVFEINCANPDIIYLVATEGHHVIGYLSCHIQLLLHHAGKVAEIQEVFVNPKKRSLGVGKLLMDEVKKLAQQQGALQLEVTSRAIREKAIQFYKREKFEDTHKKLVFYFTGE